MSPETERMIRDSWQRIGTDTEGFLVRFYARLFELDPEVRALFANADASAQHRRFAEMLGELVSVLDDPRRLVFTLAAAGRRHVEYGVRDGHYEIVGVALVDALAESLGEAFTSELREAWRETYGLLAAVMSRGSSRTKGSLPPDGNG